MPKDVVVIVNIDAKPSGTENLDILLLSTEGVKDVAVYRDLDVIKETFTGKKVATMAEALFDQGKTTLAETLIRKVKIAGIAAPAGSDESEKATALVAAVETLRATDDDWYILLTDQDGDEAVKALCAWAEATEPTEAELGAGEEDHRKLYFGRTQNKSLAVTNRRSIVIYGDQDEEYPDAAYVGKTVRVLVDGESDDPEYPLTSRTEGNRLVRLKGDKALIGQFADVAVTGSNTWALFGEMV